MLRLVILADDLTGAIDTGVQMSELGIPVFFDPGSNGEVRPPEETQVFVVNTCSRHLPPEAAYRRVKEAAERALADGAAAVYKKTDSGLRGNVGAEIQAVLDAGGGVLAFVPAYPKMGRIVRDGALYVGGLPVTQSVFGSDLFTPVRHDRVADILAEQSAAPVARAGMGEAPERGVWLFDAETEADMRSAARAAQTKGGVRLYAGCAGFAAYLPELIPMEKREKRALPAADRFLIVSGSASETTLSQLQHAQALGYESVTLRDDDLYTPDLARTARGQELVRRTLEALRRSKRVLIDAVGSYERITRNIAVADSLGLKIEDARALVARNVGALASAVIGFDTGITLGVFGGDTLYEVLSALQCSGIEPLGEIEAGVVYSECRIHGGKNVMLVSKSGNFGNADLFERIDAFLFERVKEEIRA